MKYKIFLSLFIVSICIQCAGPVEQQAEKRDSIPSKVVAPLVVHATDSVLHAPHRKPDSIIVINSSTSVNVLSVEKQVESSKFPEDVEKCNKWQLNAANITTILRNGEPTDNATIHDLYSTYNCTFSGNVVIGIDTFKYVINAGSHFQLWSKDTIYVFACPAKKCKKFFLEGEYTLEDINN